MDKLLNIGRQGGYPLCAETLQVLYDNARAVNVLLAGLELPNKTAVIMGAYSGTEASNGYRYLYVVTGYGNIGVNSRLVRYTTGAGVSMLDLSSAKVTITETEKDVHDNNDNAIPGVYREERAVIEQADSASERWTFYRLKDVLEPAIYKDLLPDFRTQIANTNVSLDEGYGNILRMNENKLRMKLKLQRTFNSSNYLGQAVNSNTVWSGLSIPFAPSGTYPLNAIAFINGGWYSIGAFLSDGTITLRMGQGYAQAFDSGIQTYAMSQVVIVNSEVLL